MMVTILCQILLSIFLLGKDISLFPQQPHLEWHLVKNKNDIRVYTADNPASGLKHLRINATFDGKISTVNRIFRNIPLQRNWVYATRNAHLVQQPDDNHILYYNETSLPWPFNNRDAAIFMTLENKENSISIIQTAMPDAIPVNKGIVRVPLLQGKWNIKEDAAGRLSIEYLLDIDPGGSIPGWMANLFIHKGPYETFVNLQKLLKE